jgi:hypothetical protein
MLGGNASDGGASRRAIVNRILCVGVLYTANVNVDSRAHYIVADGETHYSLIEGIASIRAGRWTWSLVA